MTQAPEAQVPEPAQLVPFAAVFVLQAVVLTAGWHVWHVSAAFVVPDT